MRRLLLLVLITILLNILPNQVIQAQSCFSTGINNSTFNIYCSAACTNITYKIPHLKSTSTYTVTTIPFAPYQYIVATGGTEDITLYDDDQFSGTFPLTFPFCFYDSIFSKAVIGSNGIITFDTSNANKKNAYPITELIPYAGGLQDVISPAYYPKSSVMGAYSDLDPTDVESPADRKIQWRVEGTAPCRKFVVSYFHVGTYGNNDCTFGTTSGTPSPTTLQIVIYESTSLIEVYIENKYCVPSTNGGNAILGVQNWNRDKAVAATGKNATVWTSANEGYRFVPSGGASNYISSELLTLGGTFIALADTATTTAGLLDISFPNVCPVANSTQYVVRTTFQSCPSGTNLVSLDTITLTRIGNLSGTTTPASPATCNGTNGAITVTANGGVAPYTFTLTGPGGPHAPQVSATSSTTFSGLGAGNYTINITDAGGCTGSVTVTIDNYTLLTGTFIPTGTTCPGVNNGTLVITPALGAAAGPYTFTLTGPGGPYIQNNVVSTATFPGLAGGTYSVTFSNATGCAGTINGMVVAAGTSITSTSATTAATCPGAPNGTITITPTSGTPLYTFSLDTGPSQSTGVFTGVLDGPHVVTITDANGCTGTKNVTVTATGTGITSTVATTPTSCAGVNNGTITITPTSGTGPYTFILDGVTTQSGATSTTFTNVSAGPSHSITITDASGCAGIRTVGVSAGTSIAVTATPSPTSCAGATDGSITINPGTPGVYTYILNPGAIIQVNNPVFTGLAAGTYSATITIASGCAGTVNNIIVLAGAGLTVTATPAATSCAGASNGSITVNPGIAGNYTYTLNPGGIIQVNNPLYTGLTEGTYSATITNASGCTGTVNNIVVVDGAGLTVTATPAATSCAGAIDGSITVNPGTAGVYTYILNPGAITQVNNPVYTGLAAGTYSATINNASGCTGTVNNIIVLPGAGLTVTATPAPTSCAGAINGSITVNPGIAGVYTYTLNPGAITQANNPVFPGLAAGTYSATISNASGCTGTVNNIIVLAGAGLTVTATPAASSCAGAIDGNITVNPGIAGVYTYTLNPGAIVQVNNPVFTGLAPGTYSATIAAATGCTGTVNNIIVLTGAALTVTATPTPTSCSGVNDGSITANPGTAGVYTYTLNPGAVTQANNPVFTGLAPGTYSISIATASGCTGGVNNIVVAAGSVLTGTINPVTATSCPTVNDGTITVVPGGTGPYVFTLNPGNIVQNNNPVFTNLSPGTYIITFTTASGCNGTVPVNPVVGQGAYLTSTTILDQPDCANINDGSITIVPGPEAAVPYASFTLTGPGGPYNQSTAIFTNLAPGNYTYSFTDGNGCTGTGAAVLSTHSPLAITVTPTMPLCNGNSNGVIVLNASGGGSSYTYAKSPFSVYQSTGTFNGLATGTYTFRVKDNFGCTKDTTVTLLEPSLLTATATNSDAASCDGNDGTITITALGGTPAYEYSINNGTSYQAGNVVTAPAVGAYPNIKVRDSKGCIANANATIVVLIDNMFLTLGKDTTICMESSLTFLPQTNAGTSVFHWRPLYPLITPVSTINDDTIKNAIASPTDTAVYILDASWGACSRSDTILINVLHKPIPNAGLDTAICNETYAILRGSATNLSGTVNFVWSPSSSVEDDSAAVTIAHPGQGAAIQTYVLTVTDNYGCNFSVKDSVDITIQPPVPAYAGNDTIAIRGVPHQLFGSGGLDYLWSPAFPLNFSTTQNPLATLSDDQLFVLRVTDIAGCIGYDSVFIKAYNGPNYYVPNAFSPNGDGINDVFRVIPVGIAKTDWFRVFNRYGGLIFETNQWLKGWDGRFKGRMQPMGTYIWIVKGLDKNGRVVEDKGTVLLVQ